MKTAQDTLPEDIEKLKNRLLSERVLSAQKDFEITRLKQQYQIVFVELSEIVRGCFGIVV